MNTKDLQNSTLDDDMESMLRSKCQITFEEAGSVLGLSRHYIDLLIKNGILDKPYTKYMRLYPSDVLLIFLRLPEDLFKTSYEHLSKSTASFKAVIGYYNMLAQQFKDTNLASRACAKLDERFSKLSEILDINTSRDSVIYNDVQEARKVLSSIILSKTE